MEQFANSLSKNTTDANAGELRGSRMFFDADYMVGSVSMRKNFRFLTSSSKVTRGSGYVTTLKMYSNRTKNTECTNSENVRGSLA
jgi:hypothetical protein